LYGKLPQEDDSESYRAFISLVQSRKNLTWLPHIFRNLRIKKASIISLTKWQTHGERPLLTN